MSNKGDVVVISGDTDNQIHKYDITRWASSQPGSPVLSLQRHRASPSYSYTLIRKNINASIVL